MKAFLIALSPKAVCPWCIQNGACQKKFAAQFNPVDDRLGDWEGVAAAVFDEITDRTPGINCWQEPMWFFHCQDAAIFLGTVGAAELQQIGEEALKPIRDHIAPDLWPIEKGVDPLEAWMASLSRDVPPTAYLFQCRHCGVYGGFSDCD